MINLKRLDNKLNWLPVTAVILITLALFPYGWLAERWQLFGRATDFIFGTELAHVAGHFILFAAVGTAVLLTFPRLQTRPRLYFGLIVLVGFLQEVLQLTTFKERPFAANELFDITIDVLGGLAAFYWLTRNQRLESRD